jgi:hypothetical protein
MSALSIFLSIHLFGALITLGVIGTALYSLAAGRADWQQKTARLLGVCTLAQVGSGSLLSVASRDSVTVGGFCARIGVYFAIIGTVEVLLFARSRLRAPAFPAGFVVRSFAGSLAVSLLTIAYMI